MGRLISRFKVVFPRKGFDPEEVKKLIWRFGDYHFTFEKYAGAYFNEKTSTTSASDLRNAR